MPNPAGRKPVLITEDTYWDLKKLSATRRMKMIDVLAELVRAASEKADSPHQQAG